MEFRILGPTEVIGPTGRTQLRATRLNALLATLILQSPRVVSVDQLLGSLFGADSPTAAATIHTYVSRLRRVLDGVEPGGGERILTRQAGYLLRIEPGELDLDVFRGEIERGRREAAAGRWPEAAEAYASGLTLWRDSALVDVSSDGLRTTEAPRLDEERLSALERRIAADLELGRHDDLVSELRALTTDHPFREQFWAQLMRALYRGGRAAEALEVYQRARRLHVDELGIEPGPELQRVHQAILANDGSLARAETPAAPAAMPAPAQLPPDIAGFVGHDALRARARELLAGDARGGTPLVVVSGLPGVGKTTFATHVAHELRHRFPDGQLYVNLRGYADVPPVTADSVISRFLRSLGVPPDRIPFDPDEQTALYRSALAGKRVLIFLDNASSADHVRPLLPADPGCALLVTSRDELAGLTALQGATRLALDVLPPADAHALLREVVGDERVDAETGAVAELARLCGGLPLALRIAAANLAGRPHLGIGAYTARLAAGDPLAGLSIKGDDQAAVRAAFDLSYAALKPDEARLFRYLGLVPGPDFTAHGAAALTDTSLAHARQLLDHLKIANLVQDRGPDRYQFHDLLRRYAVQQCTSMDSRQDRDTALKRLLSLYFQATSDASKTIEPVRPRPEPPRDHAPVAVPDLTGKADALAWLDQEFTNLMAALTHAAEHGPYSFAWPLADALSAPLALSTRFADWVSTAQAGLRAALADGVPHGEAAMRMGLGYAYNTTGLQDLAITEFGRALSLYRELDQPMHQVLCHYPMSMAFLWTGRLSNAIEHLHATLDLATRLDSTYYEANAVHGLGLAHRYLGDLGTALEELISSLEIGERTENAYAQAVFRLGLGLTYRDLGRFDEALAELTETLSVFAGMNNAFGESRALNGIASVHIGLDALPDALEAAERALEKSRRINHRRTETDALNVLATIRHRQGRLPEALDGHDSARAVAETMGPYACGLIEATIGLAAVTHELGDPGEARGHAEEALKIIDESGFRLHRGAALIALAQIEADLGDLVSANEHCTEALAVCRDTGQRPGEARARHLLDRIRGGLG
ncbi:MAG TPA: BTAD domain-containing putative transcriptional regulator [Amycolatopsis sp.]|nr:BTAD domain-containing putative transcriptional regulator [Amycolatopsis sp.]